MPAAPLAATLHDTIVAGFVRRATLVLNHVLRSEPAAVARLQPHAGKRVELHAGGAPRGWPLPPLSPLQFEVTRAGLLDADVTASDRAAELVLTLDLTRPLDTAAGWLGGARPGVNLAGDAGFAADVSWLVEHLRWDVEDDLERLVGPAAAHGAARAGALAASAARELLAGLASLRAR
jgi:ubiquinone biosynthesis protein UbiJ